MEKAFTIDSLSLRSLNDWLKVIFEGNKGPTPRQFWISKPYLVSLSDENFLGLINSEVQLIGGSEACDYIDQRMKIIEMKEKIKKCK